MKAVHGLGGQGWNADGEVSRQYIPRQLVLLTHHSVSWISQALHFLFQPSLGSPSRISVRRRGDEADYGAVTLQDEQRFWRCVSIFQCTRKGWLLHILHAVGISSCVRIDTKRVSD